MIDNYFSISDIENIAQNKENMASKRTRNEKKFEKI